jgi:hypothetical protein
MQTVADPAEPRRRPRDRNGTTCGIGSRSHAPSRRRQAQQAAKRPWSSNRQPNRHFTRINTSPGGVEQTPVPAFEPAPSLRKKAAPVSTDAGNKNQRIHRNVFTPGSPKTSAQRLGRPDTQPPDIAVHRPILPGRNISHRERPRSPQHRTPLQHQLIPGPSPADHAGQQPPIRKKPLRCSQTVFRRP